MSNQFPDETFLGLPKPSTDVADTLWDVSHNNKKYVKTWPATVDSEMYAVLQFLSHHPDLPFQGNMSALSRHALASLVNSLTDRLSEGMATLWDRLRSQQRHLTNERYALHIDEILDKQVEFLREWSLAGEWEAVVEDLLLADKSIAGYPNPWWRRRAVQGWLKHRGVRGLMDLWQERMLEEAPQLWADVRKLFGKWEEIARV